MNSLFYYQDWKKNKRKSVMFQWFFYEDLVREWDENGGIKWDMKGWRGYMSNLLYFMGDFIVCYQV